MKHSLSLLLACAPLGLAPWTAQAVHPGSQEALLDWALDDEDPPEDEATEVSIEYITSIDYKPGKELPKEIQNLDGLKVMITGYMAIGTEEGSAMFELVPESCECGRSKPQHFIEVNIEDGGVTYQPGRIDLVGTFSVGEVKEDGFVTSLYRLQLETAP